MPPLDQTLYGLYGTGGTGREVTPLAEAIAAALSRPDHPVTLCLVDQQAASESFMGHRVLSEAEFLATPGRKRFTVAIGDSRIRQAVFRALEGAGAQPTSIIVPSALVGRTAIVAPGAIIAHYVVITENVHIGKGFHCSLQSFVAHDCVIGDFVTLAAQVAINGNVVIGDHVYIGTGAIIKNGEPGRPLTIGAGAVIGMGAVVTRDVPPGVTVVGNPARPLPA